MLREVSNDVRLPKPPTLGLLISFVAETLPLCLVVAIPEERGSLERIGRPTIERSRDALSTSLFGCSVGVARACFSLRRAEEGRIV